MIAFWSIIVTPLNTSTIVKIISCFFEMYLFYVPLRCTYAFFVLTPRVSANLIASSFLEFKITLVTGSKHINLSILFCWYLSPHQLIHLVRPACNDAHVSLSSQPSFAVDVSIWLIPKNFPTWAHLTQRWSFFAQSSQYPRG